MIFAALSACLLLGQSSGSNVPWRGYGGDPQHDAVSPYGAGALSSVRWTASLDDQRSYYGDEVLIHYASACITPNNTVVHSYRFTTTSGGTPDYDNWRVIGRLGATGAVVWQLDTDYSAPVVFPSDWTSVYPLALSGTSTIAAAGGGGTILFRLNADTVKGQVGRVSFYSAYANYNASPSSYAPIKICTPLTADAAGNVWFGYTVTGSIPGKLASVLGTGGVARVTTSGAAAFEPVQALYNAPGVSRPALNAAPALSPDGSSVYFSLCDGGTYNAYLVKLNSQTLAPEASVRLMDPSVSGPAGTINESSGSPMVGPDGHVFYGVFGYYWRESHGWMLQFDQNLNQYSSAGKRWPVGSFGWDDTPSVVPTKLIRSYSGSAPYLILTKYNNYALGTGDGVNKVAVLDPSSDSVTKDRQSGIPVMNEVLTVVGPTPDAGARDSGFPKAVREWCINSAAVDPASDSAIVNSEDGHAYRWSFSTNTLSQVLNLAPATGEAYTSTIVGPDGTAYAINNSVLNAMGDLLHPTGFTVDFGSLRSGSTASLKSVDNQAVIVSSGNYVSLGGLIAGIEAVFQTPTTGTVGGIDVSVTAMASTGGVTEQVFAKNFQTGNYDFLGQATCPTTYSNQLFHISSSGGNYRDASGNVHVVVRGLEPEHIGIPFTFSIDQVAVSAAIAQ